MKKLIFLVILTVTNLVSSNLFAQKLTDTIFLLKEKNDSEFHVIFIDPNRQSNKHKSIIDFSSFPKVSKKNKIRHENLPAKWIPLYSYEGDFYVYYPCDFSTNQQIHLTNKTLFFKDFELYRYQIDSFEKENDRFIINYNGFENEKTKIEITIVDQKRKIAVFKYIRNNSDIDYELMIASKNVSLFPIIVNECRYSKAKEFLFDVIDFETMIKSRE
jgi:hypothetical protein